MPVEEKVEGQQQIDELEEGAEIQKPEEKKEEVEQKKPDDSAELRSAMAELASTVKTLAEPKKEEKQFTKEEIAEFWAVYDPEKGRPDFIKKFFRLTDEEATPERVAEVKALFADMQSGMMKQAVTGAKNLITNEISKFRDELKETFDFVSTAKAERIRVKFGEAYPVLSDEKYAKVVTLTAKSLADKTFENESSYFKALAEGAAETIKAVVPDFDLGAKVEKKDKPAGNTPRLPRSSAGGTGGAGSGGGKAKDETSSKGDIDSLD